MSFEYRSYRFWTNVGFKNPSRSPVGFLWLFDHSDLQEIIYLMEKYHDVLPYDRGAIRNEMRQVVSIGLKKHKFLDAENVKCTICDNSHIYYVMLNITVNYSDDLRELNVFKLKHPDISEILQRYTTA